MGYVSYKKLEVWQKSMDLVCEIYSLTRLLPKDESFALIDQMRRAAVSIPSNIAEGQARFSDREFIRFLKISQGSRAELETQLELCLRLEYLKKEQTNSAFELLEYISKMLVKFINKLQQTN